MPRVSSEERVARDALVLRMFLSGASLREIARHPNVKLSKRGVELAVERQLAADGPHRRVLAASAESVYIQRLELLLRSSMPRALAGDLRAVEQCRKLLVAEARFYGLYDVVDDLPASDDGADTGRGFRCCCDGVGGLPA
jgi:hypothetical protein